MHKIRNTLVLLRLSSDAEKTVGKITVPTNNDCFTEADVIAVGPGMVSAGGGVSETLDLKFGQRVFVKHKARANGPMGPSIELTGIPYRVDDELFHLYEQGSILSIISEPTLN